MGNAKSIRNNNYSVAMKKLIYISLCASLFFCSCEKSPVADNPGSKDNEIIVPSGEYIHFNTEALTRGTLINGGTLQADFDVIGYRYASDWAAFKVQARPNVFPRTVGENTYDHVETISYNESGGYHDYTDPVEWTADKYAFFAYYPSSDADDVSIETSSPSYDGTPYIIYTLPVADITKHMDVMTACNKDTRKQASKHGVDLSMQHRLSALDFVGYSYVNAEALNSMNTGNTEWENLASDTPVQIEVEKLTITLGGLKYNKATISLDETEDLVNGTAGVQSIVPSATEGHDTTQEFTYIDAKSLSFDYGETAFLSNMLDDNASKEDEEGNPMILIPQSTPITCTVNITYSIKVNGVTIDKYTSTAEDEIKKLDEKVYNYVLLAFTKTGLYLKVEQGTQWNEVNVGHQFE